MRIKSFYASTVEGAVALARRDLGSEAMLVQSRKAPVEARHLGEYEVVGAIMSENEATRQVQPVQEDSAPHGGRLARELAELRKQLDVMGKTITRSAWNGPRWTSSNPEMCDLNARLMSADISVDLAHQILDAAHQRTGGSPVSSASLESAIRSELEKRILVKATLGPEGSPRVAALVGPPGAGKTTTIAKLAVQHGLTARRPVQLLSMDDYRVAGADQLRSYAAILGAGFQSLDTVSGLAQALAEHQGKGLMLLDTPGYGPRDIDRAAELAAFLSAQPSISTQLVLTATMKSADLTRVAERFDIFSPSSLLFTRLDETDSFGTAFSVAAGRGKPISFLGTGQVIPEDLVPATRDRILNLLWPETSALSIEVAA